MFGSGVAVGQYMEASGYYNKVTVYVCHLQELGNVWLAAELRNAE